MGSPRNSIIIPHGQIVDGEIVGEGADKRIRIVGRVLDGLGEPIPDALIEFWQADSEGRYGAEKFGGFGRQGTGTDPNGRFVFDTINSRGRRQGPRRCSVTIRRVHARTADPRLYEAVFSPTEKGGGERGRSGVGDRSRGAAAHADRITRDQGRARPVPLRHSHAGRERNRLFRRIATLTRETSAKPGSAPLGCLSEIAFEVDQYLRTSGAGSGGGGAKVSPIIQRRPMRKSFEASVVRGRHEIRDLAVPQDPLAAKLTPFTQLDPPDSESCPC